MRTQSQIIYTKIIELAKNTMKVKVSFETIYNFTVKQYNQHFENKFLS